MRTYNVYKQKAGVRVLRNAKRPLRGYEFGKLLGLNSDCSGQLLRALKKGGWAHSVGEYQKRVWSASAKTGWPKDGRGATVANLDYGRRDYDATKSKHKPVAKHALDAAWGWMPNTKMKTTLDVKKQHVQTFGAELRPEET